MPPFPWVKHFSDMIITKACVSSFCFYPAVTCPGLTSLPPNSTAGQKPESIHLGMKFSVMCMKGFVKVGGGNEVQCERDGQLRWTYGEISCRPVTTPGNDSPFVAAIKLKAERMLFSSTAPLCSGPISLPHNSTFAIGEEPKNFSLGMKAAVICNEGFVKVGGGQEVQCGPGGHFRWPLGKISCRQVRCSDPRTPQTSSSPGLISQNGFKVSSKLSFSCEEGSEMVGEAVLTCRSDGQWSSPVPTCKLASVLLLRGQV